MIQLFADICDLVRPLLFVVLLLYLPLKTGFLFDVLIKPPSPTEMRSSREALVDRLAINGASDFVLLPLRLLLIGYLSLWLLIDKHPAWWAFAFIATLIPVFTS